MKNTALLLNIFTYPGQAFSHLKNSPSYFYPLFLAFLIKTASLLVYFYCVDFNWMVDQIIQQYSDQISEENKPQLADSLMNVGKGPFAVISIIGSLINIVLGCLVFAGYLLLATTLIGGASEKITYRQYFSVVSWSAVVVIISSVGAFANTFLSTAGQLGLEQLNPFTLENLFPGLAKSELFFAFILKADLALLWVFALIAIGYKALTFASFEKSYIVAFFPLISILMIQVIAKTLS